MTLIKTVQLPQAATQEEIAEWERRCKEIVDFSYITIKKIKKEPYLRLRYSDGREIEISSPSKTPPPVGSTYFSSEVVEIIEKQTVEKELKKWRDYEPFLPPEPNEEGFHLGRWQMAYQYALSEGIEISQGMPWNYPNKKDENGEYYYYASRQSSSPLRSEVRDVPGSSAKAILYSYPVKSIKIYADHYKVYDYEESVLEFYSLPQYIYVAEDGLHKTRKKYSFGTGTSTSRDSDGFWNK